MDTLVNENDPAANIVQSAIKASQAPEQSSPVSTTRDPSEIIGAAVGKTNADLGIKSPQQLAEDKVALDRKAILPKSWFGELWQGGKVGIDQLQQLGYAGGAIAADAAGMDDLKDWFIKGSQAQDKEIAGEPLSVEDSSGINSFDSFMRWFSGSAGKAVPQLAQSAISGAVGALAGSAIGPEGTFLGGLTGFVERQAIVNALKKGLTGEAKDQLKDYAAGKIAKAGLNDMAQAALVNESKTILKQYGAEAVIGLNSWATETASIYDSTKNDPDTSDSNKKASAILGGLVAAIPDTAFKSYIASKFFPQAAAVHPVQIADASNYLVRFAKAAAKEMPKVIASGFGEEYAQTMVETAAQSYSNPATRDKVFDFTSEQWHQFLEAGYQGAVAEGTFGGVISSHAEALLKPSTDPKVREKQAKVEAMAADLQPASTAAGPEDQRLSAIAKRRDEINTILANPNIQEPDRTAGQAELAKLEEEEGKILGAPLVNENEVTPPKPSSQADQTGISGVFSNLAGGAVDSLYDYLFAKLQAGDTTELGKPSNVLIQAMPLFQSGQIKTTQDLKAWVKTSAEAESAATKTVVKPPVRTLTPLEQAVAHLRAFYAQEMPIGESSTTSIPLNTAGVAQQREKLTNLVNEITKTASTPEEAQTYGTAIHQAFDDNVLNFLHHEGIDLRQPTERDIKQLGKENFGVLISGKDNISMVLPSIDAVREQSGVLAVDSTQQAKDKSLKGYLASVPGIIQHEITHAFDWVALRDEWRESGEGSYGKFLKKRIAERGAALRQAWGQLPRQAFTAYNFGEPGKLNDEQLGDEFMRMVVQAVRTGKIDEVTQALFRAESEEAAGGKLSNMLARWVEALKGIYAKMKAVLDPKTAPPEFIKDFDAITKALDKYKVLVNEKTSNEQTKTNAAAKTNQQTQNGVEQNPNVDAVQQPNNVGTTSIEPQADTTPLTIQEALDRNAKVEWQGIRGRLVRDTDGALVVRNKDNDYLVKDAYEPGQSVADIGLKVLKASPAKEDIRTTQQILNEAPPETAAAEVSRHEVPAVPAFVQDAENHPLLNELSDLIEVGQSKQPRARKLVNESPEFKRLLSRVTPEMLNRAEMIVTNTIDRIEKLGLAPEEQTKLAQPFYDLWNGIDTLRQQLAQVKDEQTTRQIQSILQASPDEAKPAETNPEPPIQQKARVTKADRAKAKLADIIAQAKAGKVNIVDAMMAHIKLGEPDARAFKELYGKGATLKLYNQVLSLVNENEKLPAQAGTINRPTFEGDVASSKFNQGFIEGAIESYKRFTDQKIADILAMKVGKLLNADELNPTERASIGFLYQEAQRRGLPVPQVKVLEDYMGINRLGEAGQSNLTATVQKNISDAEMMSPGNPTAFLEKMRDSAIAKGNQEAANNFQAAIDHLTKAPAQAGGLRPKDQRIISESESLVNEKNQVTFTVKPSEQKDRATTVLWQGTTPRMLRYDSLTETQAAFDAQEAINRNGGAYKTGLALVEDKQGSFLGFNEDDPHSILPSAKVFSTMANVRDQLLDIARDMANKGASMDALSHVRGIHDVMEARLAASTTIAGQASQLGDSGMQIRDGASARRTFVDTIMDGVEKILGGTARQQTQALVTKLNDNMAQASGLASVAPKVIKYIREIEASLKGARFEKGYRQTVVKNLKKLNAVVNKAAARAAQYIASSDDNDAKLDKLASYLVSQFSGLPQAEGTRTAEQVFMTTVSRFVRSIGQEMGLITKAPTGTKESVALAMATILKNHDAYQRFANAFVADYVKEYGGTNPSSEFRNQANQIYAKIMQKSDGRDLIKPLVNEKMRQLEMKFSQIVREEYEKGNFAIQKIRDAISTEMHKQGVTDPALINQLAQDVEESMQGQVQDAREKFFGSSPTIREFLRHIQTNLREVTTSLAIHSDKLEGQLKEALIEHFGFPDTPDLPIASHMASIMQQELNELVAEQNAKEIQTWLNQAEKGLQNDNPSRRKLLSKSVEKVLQMTKAGVMRQEDVYRALAEHFTELPPYKQETVDELERIGEAIYNSQHPRQINALKQEAADLLTQAQPLTTTKARTAAMYFSFLSGPSTIMGANPGGNTAQLIAYIGENILKSIHNPKLIYQMMRAVFSTAVGKAAWEARETWYNGMELGKQSSKYMTMRSPFELDDPYFKSDIIRNSPLKNRLADIDEKMSTSAFKIAKFLGGKYVLRALLATDIYFGKIAEEIAFTQKVGQQMGTERMFLSAMDEARSEMLAIGQDPDASRENRSRLMVLANSIYENARLHDANGNLVNERAIAWMEAHNEALRVTLNQEPKGLFGALHRAIQNASNAFPALRLFIPFTRIAANSVNMALEFTPIGFARYILGGEFKKTVGGNATFDENGQLVRKGGEQVRDTDILIRAAMGTTALFALASLMGANGPEDKEEPYFWIYGNGPRDKTMRGLLFERGWKPNSVKVGGTYYNYLLTPFAMSFSILGYHADKYLDGQLPSPNSIGIASSGVALMDAVTNQSFLASISDFMGAVDSPDPENKLNRLFARTASVVIPSFVKQIDRFVDPSLQQADSFKDVMMSQIPFARQSLKPYLNYFGQPVVKAHGSIPLPGMQVLATEQRSDDAVVRFLTDNSIDLPGYSKATRLNKHAMTDDQRYEYVQIAGPKIHERIQAELSDLETMDREDQKAKIRQIAEEEKTKARHILEEKYYSR